MPWIDGEIISLILFFIGVYGLIARRNMVKAIISLGVMQSAIILYFLSAGALAHPAPPIGDVSTAAAVADPLPQAMMITDIVIGIGTTAVALTMVIHLYHQYGTTNWLRAKWKRKG